MDQQKVKGVTRLNESTIKKRLEGYLRKNEELFYREFILTTGRMIDFITFKWKDDYEIEICGYECKGTYSAKATAKTLREQVTDYQKVVPSMYLAINAKEKEKENIKTLCSLNGVGLLLVTQEGISPEVEAPKERQPLLDDNYYKPLRTNAAMFLSFRECYDDLLRDKKPREGIRSLPYWCSTPEPNDKVQYNCAYNEESKSVYSAVNLENSRKVFKKVDLGRLTKELTSLPDEYWIKAGITNYPAPRMALYSSLIHSKVGSLNIDDLRYLAKRARAEVVWFQVGKDIWDCDDILPRKEHIQRVKQARNDLTGVHQIMLRKKS